MPLAALLCACGPSLAPDGDEPATDTGASDADATDSSGPVVDPPAMSTSGPPPTPVTTSGDPTTSGTDTGAPGDSSGDPYACGCDPSIEVDYEQPIEGEVSAASVLATVADSEQLWEWDGVAGKPRWSTLRLALEYNGGAVLHGPEGDDGCAFLSAPCPNALYFPVVVSATTDDGILAMEVPGTLDVNLEPGDKPFHRISLRVDATADMLRGTLLEQPLLDSDEPLAEVTFSIEWRLDGSEAQAASLYGQTVDGTFVSLGHDPA